MRPQTSQETPDLSASGRPSRAVHFAAHNCGEMQIWECSMVDQGKKSIFEYVVGGAAITHGTSKCLERRRRDGLELGFDSAYN